MANGSQNNSVLPTQKQRSWATIIWLIISQVIGLLSLIPLAIVGARYDNHHLRRKY